MKLPIILGSLITEQELRKIMPIESIAVHALSQYEFTEVSLWEIVNWFNQNNSKLMIDLFQIEDSNLGTSYLLAGLDWEDVPENLTKKALCDYVASEIHRLSGVNTTVSIIGVLDSYCFYNHKQEDSS